MGSLFSKRRTATDELELIVLKLDKLHSRALNLQKNRYNFLWYMTVLFLFASSVYSGIICAKDVQPRYAYIALTWVIGILFYFVIRFLSVRLFDFMLQRDEKTVQSLNEQRSKIIENVKENEKFKVAKEIIEKYGGADDLLEIKADKKENTPPPKQSRPSPTVSKEPTPERETTEQEMQTPLNAEKSYAMVKRQGIGATNRAFITPAMRRQPIRPYIQPVRTPIDKIIDYIIGDGPSNRFALICNQCRTHNGMALKEEFSGISFICFNCGLFNPARESKHLLAANPRPQLCDTPVTTPLIRTATNSESSDNDSVEAAEENTLKHDKTTDSAEKAKSKK
ncbi:Endoplasmic reticulum junction formation protein lunapark [Aphelenchoides bicaudatus]|nr:Endoplasmic reticulum junction formation protein lunapark [Aphelenchoides bicaudatus]